MVLNISNPNRPRRWTSRLCLTTLSRKYGVLWFQARTEVDKVNRQVTLDDFQITAAKFLTMPEREEEYKAFLRQRPPAKSKVLALDRIEAELAASNARSL